MKKYMLVMLLTVGIGANPIICNEVTSTEKKEEQVKKEKHISSAIACLGALVSCLVKEIGKQTLEAKSSELKKVNRGAAVIVLTSLATAIGYDVWKGNRGIISSSINQSLHAFISYGVVSWGLGLVVTNI